MGNRNAKQQKKYMLDANDRNIVRNYWSQLKQKQPELFADAWLAAMETDQKIKDVFGIVEDEDPVLNESFQRTTEAVEHFFHRLIFILHFETQQCNEECQALGAKHVEYADRGFQTLFWDTFTVCIMTAIEEHLELRGNKRRMLIDAWQKFVHVVVHQLRVGFDREVMHENA